jgi:serine/threonine-protein kinase
MPQPGDVIAGKYRVERPIGRGGMGAVFEVSHSVTGKHFAIKWLMTEPTASDDSVTRFVREAQVAGRCEHRNIVEVYDIDRDQGQLFMVMELLKGETLAERLQREGRQPYRAVCQLLLPCIEAVAEAHGSGIIHRDLKPANIFICQARGREPEYAKVLDFGVSRFTTPFGQFEVSTETKSGAVVGTPFYMSPEQMRGHPIDARADVYSMGVTLYEALTGIRPFDATSYGDLLLKITEAKPTPLEQMVEGLPLSLSAAVRRAMSPDPMARFASMEELARALEPHAGWMATIQSGVSQWHTENPNGDTPLVSETDLPALLSNSAALRARRRRLGWGLAAATASVALLGGLGWRSLAERQPSAATAASPVPALDAPAAPATNTETQLQPATEQHPQQRVSPQPVASPAPSRPTQPEASPAPDSAAVAPREPTRPQGHGSRKRAASGVVGDPWDGPSEEQPSRSAPSRRKGRAPARLERGEF